MLIVLIHTTIVLLESYIIDHMTLSHIVGHMTSSQVTSQITWHPHEWHRRSDYILPRNNNFKRFILGLDLTSQSLSRHPVHNGNYKNPAFTTDSSPVLRDCWQLSTCSMCPVLSSSRTPTPSISLSRHDSTLCWTPELEPSSVRFPTTESISSKKMMLGAHALARWKIWTVELWWRECEVKFPQCYNLKTIWPRGTYTNSC